MNDILMDELLAIYGVRTRTEYEVYETGQRYIQTVSLLCSEILELRWFTIRFLITMEPYSITTGGR